MSRSGALGVSPGRGRTGQGSCWFPAVVAPVFVSSVVFSGPLVAVATTCIGVGGVISAGIAPFGCSSGIDRTGISGVGGVGFGSVGAVWCDSHAFTCCLRVRSDRETVFSLGVGLRAGSGGGGVVSIAHFLAVSLSERCT